MASPGSGFGPAPAGVFSRRRLPIYIVLDHSAAVDGTAMVSLNGGLQNLRQTLGGGSQASLTYISLIAFADVTHQVPLGLVEYFRPPRLVAEGVCHFGAALEVLQQRLSVDLIPDRPGRAGDGHPLVFLLLAGQPFDSWQAQGDWLLQQGSTRSINVVGVALGEDAIAPLKRCAPTVLKIERGRAMAITGFFHWVNNLVDAAL